MYMQLYLNDRCIVYANFMVLVHAEVMFFALSCPLMLVRDVNIFLCLISSFVS